MRHPYLDRSRQLAAAVGLAALLGAGNVSSAEPGDGWSHYGGSLGGDRYAAPSGITPESVGRLSLAWVYRTGDATDGDGFDGNPSRFHATPILVGGKLIASTGFNRVFAVDAGTGEEVWTFDPKVSFAQSYSEMFTSRGVAAWQDAATAPRPCRARVLLARSMRGLLPSMLTPEALAATSARVAKWICRRESRGSARVTIP